MKSLYNASHNFRYDTRGPQATESGVRQGSVLSWQSLCYEVGIKGTKHRITLHFMTTYRTVLQLVRVHVCCSPRRRSDHMPCSGRVPVLDRSDKDRVQQDLI